MPSSLRLLALAAAVILLALPASGQISLQAPVPLDAAPLAALPATAAGAVTFSQDAVRSSDIAVDAQGNLHVAFVSLGQTGNPQDKPAMYGFCPGTNLDACASPAGWTLVRVGQDWQGVRLALTPAGQPRLFLYDDRATVEGFSATIYAYAECDQNCTAAPGWRLRTLGASRDGGNINADRVPVHRFALDPQGRPRFVYYFGTRWLTETQWEQPAYFVHCNANCATTGEWEAVRLPDAYLQNEVHDLENASLSFSPAGAPRLLWTRQFAIEGPSDTRDVLLFAECALPCTTTAHWPLATPLVILGSGPDDRSFSARTDASGGIHVAAKAVDDPLYYLWCANNCGNGDNWFGYPLNMASNDGEHPAIALDAAGNPRLAFKDAAGGLGYAWCDGACRTGSPQWTRALVEDEDDLMEAFPIALPPACVEHYWFGGMRPSLALDAAGNPRFAYDAEYSRRCFINPEIPSQGTFIERLMWTSRFGFFPNPGAPVSSEPPAGEARLALAQPYPNPAVAEAGVAFELDRAGPIRLVLYDVLGRQVAVVREGMLPAGVHRASLDTRPLAAGRYVLRLETAGASLARSLTVIR